jgi:hypothetical protein
MLGHEGEHLFEGLDFLLGSLGPPVALFGFEVLEWQIGRPCLLLTVSLKGQTRGVEPEDRIPWQYDIVGDGNTQYLTFNEAMCYFYCVPTGP